MGKINDAKFIASIVYALPVVAKIRDLKVSKVHRVSFTLRLNCVATKSTMTKPEAWSYAIGIACGFLCGYNLHPM